MTWIRFTTLLITRWIADVVDRGMPGPVVEIADGAIAHVQLKTEVWIACR